MKRKKWLDGTQNKRVERDAGGFQLLYNTGVKCIERENYEGAIEVLTNATEYNRESSDAWYQLGNAYMGAGRYQEAISPLKKAIELTPKYIDTLFDGVLEKEVNTKYVIALSDLGLAYAEIGLYQEAICCLEEATELNPILYLSLYELGNTYVETKQYEKAIAPLKKAIELDSNFVAAQCKLSEANIRSALNKVGTPLSFEILEIVGDYSIIDNDAEVVGDCN